jgi:coenzyme F420 hydrogenase subunit beta
LTGSNIPVPPHERARPLAKGSTYPAKDLCSQCGLCDSRWVAYVRQACAFLNQQFDAMEARVHGRSRDLDNADELYFGVHQRMLTARLQAPIAGAQWTGIVSRIGVRALETGLVDAVLCVQQSPDDRFTPVPVLARSPAEVLAARVNKPTLSPNLRVLEELEGSGIRRLLAIAVGCQVQALRAVQATLPLESLHVLGLPCVDNVSRAGLQTFLNSASRSADTVVHYEFMQDFRIHFRHGAVLRARHPQAQKRVRPQLPELLRLHQCRRRSGGGLHGRRIRPPVDHGAQPPRPGAARSGRGGTRHRAGDQPGGPQRRGAAGHRGL